MVKIWEREGYIRKGRFTERWIWTQVSRDKEETRRTLREKRVNNSNSYVIVASSDKLVKINWFTYLIRSAFSSLFLSLGEAPLWISGSLSYKFFVLGDNWTYPATILSGPRSPDFFGPYNIYIYIYTCYCILVFIC